MVDLLSTHALALAAIAVYAMAAYSAARALLYTRTAQGSTAWVLALLLMPVLTLPLYWVFGHTRFQGYVIRRQARMAQANQHMDVHAALDACLEEPDGPHGGLHTLARRLGAGGFTHGNRLRLLVDGEDCFRAILDAIASAQRFVLIQYYIFRPDATGRRFQQALIERARAGVRVCFLYDEIGSRLSRRFLGELEQAGVCCRPFDPGRKGQRLQINFRNHRKIVIVDGSKAFLGGLNVGDDYLGRHRNVGPWRDTHLEIQGPGAVQAQIACFKDWYWATDALPDVPLTVQACEDSDGRVLVWHTGPADPQPEALLFWLQALTAARERIWLATPYFVPPEPILHALRLALVRGVEVRLLVPGWNDNRLVALASQVHLADMANCGAEIYRWPRGFMHQKVSLIDRDLTLIGSANLDHRSLFINFEITALSTDAELIDEVEAMLDRDWQQAQRVSLDEFRNASYWRRLACRSANLFSPML